MTAETNIYIQTLSDEADIHIHYRVSCYFSNTPIGCPFDRMLILNQVAVPVQAVLVLATLARIPTKPRTGDPLLPRPPILTLMRKEVHIPSSRDARVG